jgi:chromosome segregation ATPase
VNPYALLVAIAIGFAGAWTTQNWRYGEQIATMQKEAAEATTKAVQEERTKAQAAQAKKDEALNAANIRNRKLADTASKLGADNSRMRDERDTAIANLSQATREAADKYTAALNTVYGSCTARLTDLAKILDGTLSDLKTLEDAWPE